MKNEVRTDSQKTTIVADFHDFHGEKILNSYVYSNGLSYYKLKHKNSNDKIKFNDDNIS